MNAAASSSAVPPISPTRTIALGCRVGLEQGQHIHEMRPRNRVAADADTG